MKVWKMYKIESEMLRLEETGKDNNFMKIRFYMKEWLKVKIWSKKSVLMG